MFFAAADLGPVLAGAGRRRMITKSPSRCVRWGVPGWTSAASLARNVRVRYAGAGSQ